MMTCEGRVTACNFLGSVLTLFYQTGFWKLLNFKTDSDHDQRSPQDRCTMSLCMFLSTNSEDAGWEIGRYSIVTKSRHLSGKKKCPSLSLRLELCLCMPPASNSAPRKIRVVLSVFYCLQQLVFGQMLITMFNMLPQLSLISKASFK